MGFPPPHIGTPRLALRPPKAPDAQTIFDLYTQDPEVARYMTWHPHSSVSDAERFIAYCEEVWAQGNGEYTWMIERREDHQVLGMIGARSDGGVRIGYVLARAFWGHGYMTEAVRALCDASLSDPNVFRVWAFCDVDNQASARVMRKAGMQFEGVLRRFSIHPNLGPEPRDCECYAKVR